MLSQLAAVNGARRRWAKTSYLVRALRVEVSNGTSAAPGQRGHLADLAPPSQLNPKSPLRLTEARHPEAGPIELAGLPDPEQVRRLILTAQAATRRTPAATPGPAVAR
ncbi:MAG TPA: hypothetical protein VGX23_19205 [Actinocrinis sp.]|nr:hypothetical protein [Actinocrinis sp.]